MRKRDALKLHNGDEVMVRIGPGEWINGYILGDPYEINCSGSRSN